MPMNGFCLCCGFFVLRSIPMLNGHVNVMAPNDVACSCGCHTHDHNVAFLHNDVRAFCCSHVDFHDDSMARAVFHNELVLCDIPVPCDTPVLYDIRVCVCDIPAFCCNLHDARVACNDHSDDDLVCILLDDELVCSDLDGLACAPRDAMDSEVVAVHDRRIGLELAPPLQLPIVTRK